MKKYLGEFKKTPSLVSKLTGIAALLLLMVSCSMSGSLDQGTENQNITGPKDISAEAFSGYYKIVAKHSGKVLDVEGGVTATGNGANIHQWAWNGGNNQQWSIAAVGSYYRIVARHSGKVLDVEGGVSATGNGANVHQWEWLNRDNQQWSLIPEGSYYRIIAKHSGKALDVTGGVTATGNGANVQQWAYGGGDNQLWKIEPVNSTPAPDYTLEGVDKAPNLPYNQVYNGPVYGAKVIVNMSRVGAAGVNKDNAIANNIGLFTLCHGGGINRPDLTTKWTRWYQEYQNVQVFRLFTGEINTWNDRGEHPRVETYSQVTWTKGGWHEWNGTFHVTKINGACIFQVFNNVNQWAMQLSFSGDGTLVLNHRRNTADQTIGTGLLGKDFDIKIRDNGLNYECYLNGKLAGSGWYDRPTGNTQFRWGMYRASTEVVDAVLFVRGAHYQ